jgi:hypothetical protein
LPEFILLCGALVWENHIGLLLKPWSEVTEESDKQASATLTCQPITDHIPAGAHVLSIHVRETRVRLTCRVQAGARERTSKGRPTSRRPSLSAHLREVDAEQIG